MDKTDKYFEKIEERLKNSFSGIKEDISKITKNIKEISENTQENEENLSKEQESLKKEVKQLKDKKEDNSEIKKFSKNITELAGYFSELKDEIRELKKAKPETKRESNVKELIEFNEVKSELAELKELIEDIKMPQQKDYSKDISLLSERIDNFDNSVSDIIKSVKSIKIPSQKDYSNDLNELAKEIGEIKGSFISRKNLDRESEKLKEKFSEKIMDLEGKQRELENKFEQSDKAPIIYSLKQEIKQLRNQLENSEQKSDSILSDIRKENKKFKEELQESNEELKNQVAYLKGRISILQKAPGKVEEKQEEVKEYKKSFEFSKPSKNFVVILISIILVVAIIAGIMTLAQPAIKTKYNYLDILSDNSSYLPMNVYYKQLFLFNIYGWEGKLSYNSTEKRVTGDSEFALFNKNSSRLEQSKILSSTKLLNFKLNNFNSSVLESDYNYTLYKNKPYFKVQFLADTINNSNLGSAAYGLVLTKYDIYLANGTITLNDNNVITINETQVINGSSFSINNSKYEIFFNPETNKSIIFYSPDVLRFDNSFYWNVHWVYVSGNNGVYSPLYVIVLEDAQLTYKNGWQVKSKYYSGDLEQYINKSVTAMA